MPSRDADLGVQVLLGDAPGFALTTNPPIPDQDGFVTEEIVNQHKNVIIFIHSTQDWRGADRRSLIRSTWMQSLNRSSEQALQRDDRRSVAAWLYVSSSGSSSDEAAVVEEGKKNGDITFVNPKQSQNGHVTTRLEQFAALLRWVRVAYNERFDFVLFVEDDSFVSIPRLLSLCQQNKNSPFFYGGFVNSFEAAPLSYEHKYYAPFVQQGTILISKNVVEVLAREIGLVTALPKWEATIANFLVSFSNGKPIHIDQFIGTLKNVYSVVPAPIVVNDMTPELMRLLNSGAPLPAQAEEMSTRGIFIDPHPKDYYKECDSLKGESCSFPDPKFLEGGEIPAKKA
jgi:hypothetical protein